MIIISRAGVSQNTARLIKHVSKVIDQKGGVVRTANIMGDRIMSRTVKGNDKKNYLIGNLFIIIFRINSDNKFLLFLHLLYHFKIKNKIL